MAEAKENSQQTQEEAQKRAEEKRQEEAARLEALKKCAIIFRIGDETNIVVAKTQQQIEHSPLKAQYAQALRIVDEILAQSPIDGDKERENTTISNIVAFCGDRGEGKTSALMTTREILLGGKTFEEAEKAQILPKNKHFKENTFKVLRLIDPAFFDNKHNLLELLIGQMYSEVKQHNSMMANSGECDELCTSGDLLKHKNLIKYFQKVRTSLAIIHKASEKNAYDNLEEIDELAAGIELKENLRCLLKLYADYFHNERVLICIDDLDLNVTDGYQMCEEIRKYLCNPSVCVVLMSIKVEQMIEVVQSYLRNNMAKEIIPNQTITEMAIRYVTKLLPTPHRVVMPKGEGIVELPVIIEDNKSNEPPFESVKDAIVKLIYRKTRYIFVNGRNVSPIVPNNLRELRLLLATLWRLEDGEKNDENHRKNKTIFKQYFYNVWIKRLKKEDVDFVASLAENNDLISINKSIVTYLAKKYTHVLGSVANSNANSILEAILNPSNTMQNLSTGDVMYVVNTLENLTAETENQRLLFFIKAFYSITLYEAYDVATIDKNHLYALSDESQVSIYKYDRVYRKMNALQRVVNGAYFTYSSGDILTKEANTLMARDIRYINPQLLKNIYNELLSKPKDAISDYEQKLNMLEFFALTTTFDAYSGEDQKESYRRSLTNPLYLTPIRPKASLVNFDVLSIFYNIINIKHTYDRWNDFYKVDNVDEQTGTILSDKTTEEEQETEEKEMQKKPSLFEIAQKNDESLYKKMMKVCSEDWKDEEERYAPEHYLISDASIRFIDVQLAIMDLALNNKRVHRVKSNKLNIRLLYNDIQSSKISLYPLKEGQGRYVLKFKFLRPICDFLTSIEEFEFDEIFSPEKPNNREENQLHDLQYALIYMASKLKFPAVGTDVRKQIKQNYPHLYRACGNADYWNKLIQKDKNYENLGTLLQILLGNKQLRDIFMANIDKLIPQMVSSPLF